MPKSNHCPLQIFNDVTTTPSCTRYLLEHASFIVNDAVYTLDTTKPASRRCDFRVSCQLHAAHFSPSISYNSFSTLPPFQSCNAQATPCPLLHVSCKLTGKKKGQGPKECRARTQMFAVSCTSVYMCGVRPIDRLNLEIVCSWMFKWHARCFWLSNRCEDLVVIYATAGLNPV
jgi:hypothetical protein